MCFLGLLPEIGLPIFTYFCILGYKYYIINYVPKLFNYLEFYCQLAVVPFLKLQINKFNYVFGSFEFFTFFSNISDIGYHEVYKQSMI